MAVEIYDDDERIEEPFASSCCVYNLFSVASELIYETEDE
jgi:hypothetical protein